MEINKIFLRQEIRDIVIAVIALTIIFTALGVPLLFSFVIVVVSFLFHELAHKFVAQKYGMLAFFKIWPIGILIGLSLALIASVSPFFVPVFLAPGAVVLHPYRFGKWKNQMGHITIRELGIISVSGPLVNLAIAAFFSLISGSFFGLLVYINGLLAFINLIPIRPLDGGKVFTWKPWLWGFLFIFSLLFISGVI